MSSLQPPATTTHLCDLVLLLTPGKSPHDLEHWLQPDHPLHAHPAPLPLWKSPPRDPLERGVSTGLFAFVLGKGVGLKGAGLGVDGGRGLSEVADISAEKIMNNLCVYIESHLKVRETE